MAYAAAAWLVCASWQAPQAAGPARQSAVPPPPTPQNFRPVLDRYCVTCHNQRLKTAGLTLDTMDPSNVSQSARRGKVARKLRSGAMPPADRPRPDVATYDAMASWLETSLDRAEAAHPDPGGPLLHRLNRAEYVNAIRDLLALDVDASALLPPDDATSGFDNIADVLGVSPALMERYLSAADQVSALAIGDPSVGPIALLPCGPMRRSPIMSTVCRSHTRWVARRPTLPLDGVVRVKLLQPTSARYAVSNIRSSWKSLDGARVHLGTDGRSGRFWAILPENATKLPMRSMHARPRARSRSARHRDHLPQKTPAQEATAPRRSCGQCRFDGSHMCLISSVTTSGRSARRPQRHAQPASDIRMPA